MLSTIVLLVTYALVTVAAQAFAGIGATESDWATRTTPEMSSRCWGTPSSDLDGGSMSSPNC